MGERLIRAGAAERTAFGVSQRLFVLSKSIRAAAQDTFLRGSPEDCRLCRQSLRDTKRTSERTALCSKGALQKESKKDEQGSQKRLPCSPFAFKMDV